eukprot:4328679-Pyramimonas_sp.AAC.1
MSSQPSHLVAIDSLRQGTCRPEALGDTCLLSRLAHLHNALSPGGGRTSSFSSFLLDSARARCHVDAQVGGRRRSSDRRSTASKVALQLLAHLLIVREDHCLVGDRELSVIQGSLQFRPRLGQVLQH